VCICLKIADDFTANSVDNAFGFASGAPDASLKR
jgi:hypothetical protein